METSPTAAPDASSLVALLDRASAAGARPEDGRAARSAVEALFRAHQDRVYGLCLRLLGEPERAREAAQDTFLIAWRRLGEFRGEGSFYAWLYGIARHVCLRVMEKKRELLTEDGVLEETDPAADALRLLRRAERDELLREAARVLDATEQEAVHLRYVDGVGQEEITHVLEIAGASGARGLLQQCRRKLARELKRLLAERGHGASFFLESAV